MGTFCLGQKQSDVRVVLCRRGDRRLCSWLGDHHCCRRAPSARTPSRCFPATSGPGSHVVGNVEVTLAKIDDEVIPGVQTFSIIFDSGLGTF